MPSRRPAPYASDPNQAVVLSRRGLLTSAGALAGAAAMGACDPRGEEAPLDTGGTTAANGQGADITPITPNEDFYVTTCCGSPVVDGAAWTLTILDRGAELATLDLATLDALDPRDKEHTLECIGANPYSQKISNAVWTGLPLLEIFAALGITVPTGVIQVKFTSTDGYTTAIPVTDLERPVWLVWRMNGVELPSNHGYPARLLIPGRYGMKNPKWIVAIEFIDEAYLGFWESNGWSDDATYQPNVYITWPERDASLNAAPVRVVGTAFAGSDPVVRVEVTTDGGRSWADAVLDYAPGADIWVLWHHDWTPETGSQTVQARCTTASGVMSQPTSDGTDTYAGYDGSMAVTVEVS